MSRARAMLVLAVLAACFIAAWLALRAPNIERPIAAELRAPTEVDRVSSAALAVPTATFTSSEPARVDANAAQPKIDEHTATATLPSSTVLYGFLLPAKGRTALVDGAVVLVDRIGDREVMRCGADGAYSFAGVAAGHYVLLSGDPRNGSARVEVDVEASTPEKRVDLQLVLSDAVKVLVKATDREGKPFEAHIVGLFMRLTAIATREPPGEWRDDFSGTANGPYGVARFEPSWEPNLAEPDEVLGSLTLDHPPPVYVSVVAYQRVLATKRIEAGVTEVTFVLDGDSPLIQSGSLRARFVDADTQAPIEAKQVTLCGFRGGNAQKEGDAYRATKLAPGLYEVQVFARGYERLDRRVRVTPGVETDLGDVPLEHEQWISGAVIDSEGHGTEMELRWDEYDREKGVAPMLDSIYVVRSKSDGSFRIAGLSRRLYLVRTMPRGESPYAEWSKLIDMSTGPVENMRVELVHGVPLAVRASDPGNWRSVRYKIIGGSSSDTRTRQLWSIDPQKILLAPGNYTIEVRADQHAEPKLIPITIASEPVDLAIP